MSSLGDRILHRTTLTNRNFIGNELHKFAYESYQVAGSVITLDIHGRHLMSNILDGYGKIIGMLEIQRSRDNNTDSTIVAKNAKVVTFRTQFLDEVDLRLAALQYRARATLEQTNSALDIVKGVATEISKAQGETAVEWDMHRMSRPIWTLMIPWTSLSKIEGEHLQADLEIADNSLTALNEARGHLAGLALDLRAYRESVDRARKKNNWKSVIGSWADELLFLSELKGMVDQGRKAISSGVSVRHQSENDIGSHDWLRKDTK